MADQATAGRTPVNPLNDRFARWLGTGPRGQAFGGWVSRTIALPQLRRVVSGAPPWTPLRRPLPGTTVAIVTTAGVHMRQDRPFRLNGDATYRAIPGTAEPGDLAITHQAYDTRDAARDINLVFPLERLRELAAEGVIGAVAPAHFGFGLTPSARALLAPGRAVGRQLAQAGVDLALLVPA